MTSGGSSERTPILRLNSRARILLPIFLVILIAVSVYRLRQTPDDGPPMLEVSGPTMGTTFNVKVSVDSVRTGDQEQLLAAVTTALERINALMSTWDPESEISRFNRHLSSEGFPVSTETAEVFRISREVSRASSGAFDVTVAPLVKAWGFGGGDQLPEPPGQDAMDLIRVKVGYELIQVLPTQLIKSLPAVEADLSAVAKGYGVDAVADAVAALGYQNYLVEVGGELRARGQRTPEHPWRVAIERPDPAARALYETVDLKDISMATSGDYRNFYERDGVWLSHLIDPRTGHPINHHLASVSVLHDACAWADAWATALIVLGPEQGLEAAEAQGLAAYFIVRDGEQSFHAFASSAWQARFPREADAPLAGS